MYSQKQTGKQSGEVVENTLLWKKQTENEPEDVALNLTSPATILRLPHSGFEYEIETPEA